MNSYLLVNNNKIYYSDIGKGTPVVLLHGYLESLDIWKEFSVDLSKSFRVISFDIPGHGKSENVSEYNSMEILSYIIFECIQKLNVSKCFLVGHSMGGYLSLMIHKLYPEKLSGFCLFHSHPYADTKETKKKRLREIDFVNEGKKDLIATFNVPNAFANDNRELFKSKILTAVDIALKTSKEGIIANLHAMMSRPDLSKSLENSKIPFLYIAGKKDNYIDFNSIISNIKMPKKSELCILENSGHMGFIEEKEKSLEFILKFINRIK